MSDKKDEKRQKVPTWRRYLWPAYRQLLLKSKKPILVGPWTGEVGIEAMYWIPWLRRLRQAGVSRDRIIPITRGGIAGLYDVPKAVELFALRTPQDIRVETKRANTANKTTKQVAYTPFDQAVVREAAATVGLSRYHVLHPAWMYQDLWPAFDHTAGLGWLQDRTAWTTMPTLPLPEGLTLPEKFLAVRFYARPTFPHREDLEGISQAAILKVANDLPVVLLNSPLFLDDHFDFTPPEHPNILKLADLVTLTPQNNLAIQCAVMARAVGFLGTYGGLGQLASLFRKPVVSLYHEFAGANIAHRLLSEALANQLGIPFHCLRVGDIPLLQSVLPTVNAQYVE